MSELVERLTKEFADKDYAHVYMEAHASSRIATQIKVLREQRGLTQAKLAELSNMKQERVCALEDVDYDAWTISTLRKLARAFDVHLQVSFIPFSQGIQDVANFSRNALEVESREVDLEHFRKHAYLIKIEDDGQWKDTNPQSALKLISHLARGPVEPNPEWQEISELKNVA